MSDLISRQDAIEYFFRPYSNEELYSNIDIEKALNALPSAKQVTGKLNNPDDSLLTADSEACKEQKSKLDTISRQAAISAVWNHVTRDATTEELERLPSVQPSGDLISRESALAEFRDGRDVYDIMESIEELPSAPDSRQRETNKEIAERIIGNTCKNRVFCELYPDACQKEKCDIYLVINTFLNTPDTDTQSRQRGEWADNRNGTFVCDQCGCKHSKSNFCPNCGADMRGEEE